MILVDTSVWIDHLRAGDATLSNLLHAGRVLSHPYIIGELALGNLNQRNTIIESLRNLPQARVATDEEAIKFIEKNALYGLGIGYIDVHLLAATLLSDGSKIWTRDRRLSRAAEKLGILATPEH